MNVMNPANQRRMSGVTVRAVVFDVYGTLLEIGSPTRPYRQLLKLLADEGHASLEDGAVKMMTTNGSLRQVADLLGCAPSTAGIQAIVADLEGELARVVAYPDVAATLESLRARGLRLAICSNLATPYGRPIEALLPKWDASLLSFEVGAVKPDGRMYAAVCAALQLEPHQILMVGDTFAHDVEGPRAFGMHAIHLTRGARWSNPGTSIQSLVDLDALLTG